MKDSAIAWRWHGASVSVRAASGSRLDSNSGQ